jgi:hypothetical protein
VHHPHLHSLGLPPLHLRLRRHRRRPRSRAQATHWERLDCVDAVTDADDGADAGASCVCEVAAPDQWPVVVVVDVVVAVVVVDARRSLSVGHPHHVAVPVAAPVVAVALALAVGHAAQQIKVDT